MTRPGLGQPLVDELAQRFTLVETTPGFPQAEDIRRRRRLEPSAGFVELQIRTYQQTTATALLADLSCDGAQIVADYVPRVGEVVGLQYRGGDHLLSVNGEVLEVGKDEAVRYFGVRFTAAAIGPEMGTGGD